MRGCVWGPTEPEARCQGINSGREKQRRQKQYPTAMRSGCENEASSPEKPGLFSEGLKQSPLQLGRRKISDVCRGAGASIAQAEGEKCVCGTHHFTAHGACLLCMFHEALSALSPERRCLFRPQTAPPHQMPSLLVSHLPPPSLTILIHSKGCYPNKPSHTSYHSSLLKLLHLNAHLLQLTPAKMTVLFSPKGMT